MREFPVFQVAKRGDEGRLCVKRREERVTAAGPADKPQRKHRNAAKELRDNSYRNC